DDPGFLVYSFAESVAARRPYYVLRALGGALFLAGALLMAFNVTMTILGRVRDEAPIFGAAQHALKAAE
ncbi:MAG: cytochrome-c oxidase, cbb3-type subunit I, partial [Ensifer sp. SSB1]|nr:cytochrome-c oxidase, cbb3-type subunit I [Ensifer sp. SSB1]